LSRERNDRQTEQLMLTKLAKAYELWGDFSRAITYLEQSLTMVQAQGDVAAQSWHWRQVAQLFRKLNQMRPALEAFETAVTLARSITDYTGEAEILTELGDLYRLINDQTQAMEHYKDALELAQAHELMLQEAQVLSGMGMSYQEGGKKRPALRELERGLEVAKRARSSRAVAEVSYRMAIVLCKQGRWEKAKPHAELAQRLYGRLADTSMEDRAETLLSRIQQNKGKSTGFFQNLLES
jgi:tetratricopeptide (TPR) repeat protein